VVLISRQDLSFISADYECIASATGEECDGFYSAGEFYYKGIELLDLNKATVSPITLAEENGYSVIGDESTFVNQTEVNNFRFQQPENYTQAACFESPLYFSW